MKELSFVIKDELGFHARPAGQLAKVISGFPTEEIEIHFNDKVANGKRLIALMTLGAKQGDTIKVTANGDNEIAAISAIKDFLENNL